MDISDVDCHVLHLPEDDFWLLDAACESVLRAGVEPRLVSGVPGNIGAARAKAYATTDKPLVCHVDSDDHVSPDWIEKLLEALLASDGACGSYSGVTLKDGNGKTSAMFYREASDGRHAERHLFYRKLIVPHLDTLASWPRLADLVTARLVGDSWVGVDICGYYWRYKERRLDPVLKKRFSIYRTVPGPLEG